MYRYIFATVYITFVFAVNGFSAEEKPPSNYEEAETGYLHANRISESYYFAFGLGFGGEEQTIDGYLLETYLFADEGRIDGATTRLEILGFYWNVAKTGLLVGFSGNASSTDFTDKQKTLKVTSQFNNYNLSLLYFIQKLDLFARLEGGSTILSQSIVREPFDSDGESDIENLEEKIVEKESGTNMLIEIGYPHHFQSGETTLLIGLLLHYAKAGDYATSGTTLNLRWLI